MPTPENHFIGKSPPLQDTFRKLGLWQIPENLTKEHAKALYTLGHDFYQKTQYAEARKVFLYLLLCAEFDSKNLLGIAACFHAEQDYAIALSIYQLCTRSNLNHPLVHLHISDCLLHFGRKREAITELKKVLENPYGSSDLEKLRIRARGMIDLIQLNPEQ